MDKSVMDIIKVGWYYEIVIKGDRQCRMIFSNCAAFGARENYAI